MSFVKVGRTVSAEERAGAINSVIQTAKEAWNFRISLSSLITAEPAQIINEVGIFQIPSLFRHDLVVNTFGRIKGLYYRNLR